MGYRGYGRINYFASIRFCTDGTGNLFFYTLFSYVRFGTAAVLAYKRDSDDGPVGPEWSFTVMRKGKGESEEHDMRCSRQRNVLLNGCCIIPHYHAPAAIISKVSIAR